MPSLADDFDPFLSLSPIYFAFPLSTSASLPPPPLPFSFSCPFSYSLLSSRPHIGRLTLLCRGILRGLSIRELTPSVTTPLRPLAPPSPSAESPIPATYGSHLRQTYTPLNTQLQALQGRDAGPAILLMAKRALRVRDETAVGRIPGGFLQRGVSVSAGWSEATNMYQQEITRPFD